MMSIDMNTAGIRANADTIGKSSDKIAWNTDKILTQSKGISKSMHSQDKLAYVVADNLALNIK